MYDVVVIGAGSSGIVLATRLVAAGARVLVLERGRAAGPPSPAGVVLGAQPGHPATRQQPVRLTAHRDWVVQHGAGVGGSSAVNGGYFIRAREADFTHWASIGGDRWSSATARPLLARLESDADLGPAPGHGESGPVPVRRTSLESGAAAAFHQAAVDLGHPAVADLNGADEFGVGAVPCNVRDARRISTATAYLSAAGPDLRTGTAAQRIRIERGRAVGVDTTDGFVPAGHVVLAAGTLGSAHLLLLSGIGPSGDLRAVGVPVVADLPVGQRISDHPQLVLDWEAPGPAAPLDNWLGAAVHFRVPDTDAVVEILQSLLPIRALASGRTDLAGGGLFLALMTPQSRGRIRLVDADPATPLQVDLHHLEHPADRATARAVLRHGLALIEQARLGPVPRGPGADVLCDDAKLDGWIAERLGTAIHTCSSAPIGEVTDPGGNVLGIDGLSVVDLSVLPRAPSRGPANTAVFLGELAAETWPGR